MASVWQIGLALCLASLAATSSASTVLLPGSHSALEAAKTDQSVYMGTVDPRDRLLLREVVHKDSIWITIRDATVFYPKEHEAGVNINAIKILDQRLDGKNGEVKVKDGGVGYNFAKIRFHSQRGASLKYIVEIYGH